MLLAVFQILKHCCSYLLTSVCLSLVLHESGRQYLKDTLYTLNFTWKFLFYCYLSSIKDSMVYECFMDVFQVKMGPTCYSSGSVSPRILGCLAKMSCSHPSDKDLLMHTRQCSLGLYWYQGCPSCSVC